MTRTSAFGLVCLVAAGVGTPQSHMQVGSASDTQRAVLALSHFGISPRVSSSGEAGLVVPDSELDGARELLRRSGFLSPSPVTSARLVLGPSEVDEHARQSLARGLEGLLFARPGVLHARVVVGLLAPVLAVELGRPGGHD